MLSKVGADSKSAVVACSLCRERPLYREAIAAGFVRRLIGSPEQAARIVAPRREDTPLAALAFSEPGGSANFAASAPAEGLRAEARLEDKEWIMRGAKK